MKRLLLLFVTTIGLASAGVAQITTFPYVQDFEAFSTCGGSCTSTCVLQENWVNAATASRDFAVDVNGTGSSQTGPSIDYAPGTSSGKYLYAEASSPCYPSSDWHLLSPTIDLTGTNDIQFTFWYHMYGQSMGTAHIDVSDDGGVTWSLDVITAWTDDQDLWQQQVVSLSAWTGSIVTVRIRYENPSSFYGDFAIDAVNIYDLLPNDAGVSAFINPDVPTCVFNDSVSVEITNFGTDTLVSANIEWEWNAAAQTTNAWTGSIAPGQSMNVFLGLIAYGAGDDLKAWTSIPNGLAENLSGSGNDTTELLALNTGLAGLYTIGGVTPDYIDFTSAITALSSYGVCGPVTFDVRDGIYNEQFVLESYVGMDSTNSVTFRSESADQTLVTLTFAPALLGENYVVAFNNADYFNFEQLTIENTSLTYGRVLDYQGESDWNRVWGCHLNTVDVTSTSNYMSVIFSASGNKNDNNWFVDNIIEGGSYGAFWYGSGTTILSKGIVFDGNDFLNNYYHGSRLYYVDNVIFTNNRTIGESTYTGTRFANYFYYCDGSFVITGNEVYSEGVSGWYYGIYLGQSDGNSLNRGLVANNMIQVGKLGATATMYGVYSTNSGFYDIHSNNILVSDGGSSSRALYATSGGSISVMNNNFTNYTLGYGVYLASLFSVTEMNYNNIHSPSGNVGYYGSDQLTFTDWQTASGFDINGLDIDPVYHSVFDLHVCADTLNGIGIAHASVNEDIDGQPRAATPDIGADEFSPLSSSFLGEDASFCVGETIDLWAGAPTDNVLWSTGDTTNMITVNTPGTYFVAISGICGTGTDTIVVSASALAYTSFLIADTLEFCTGGSALLSSSMPADTYMWTGGITTPTLMVTTGGTYQLDITDACGAGSETIVITEHSIPTASFTWVNSFATGIFTNTTGATGSPTYSWDFGDGNTSTDSDPTHIYSAMGTYYVELTVTNACGSSTIGDSVTVSSVGLTDLFAAGDVSVFPNPSTGEFTISMDVLSSTNIAIQVENILGAILYESNPGEIVGVHNELVSLGAAPSGMYFVRILAGEKQLIKKIILE